VSKQFQIIQIKVRVISKNSCNFLKFTISVRVVHCDCSPPAPIKAPYAVYNCALSLHTLNETIIAVG
jgi:hypothetical protein